MFTSRRAAKDDAYSGSGERQVAAPNLDNILSCFTAAKATFVLKPAGVTPAGRLAYRSAHDSGRSSPQLGRNSTVLMLKTREPNPAGSPPLSIRKTSSINLGTVLFGTNGGHSLR